MSIIENKKFHILYDAVDQMYGSYTFCPLPLYDNSGKTQESFEHAMKGILLKYRNDYVSRVEYGEDPETVLSELLLSSLAEIRDAVE